MTEHDQDTSKRIPPKAVEEEVKAIDSIAADCDGGAKEAKQLSRGLSARDLRKEAEEAEHARSQRFRNNFETISIVAMWSIAGVVGAFGVTWFWHLVTPALWHWLTDDQVEKIQNIFAGLVLAGLLSDHFRKRLS